MSWNGTATTLTWPPVRASQSGARRCSGSATCGPLKVRMLMLTPANDGALGAGAAGLSLGSAAIAVVANVVAAIPAAATNVRPRMNPGFAMSLLLPTTAADIARCLATMDSTDLLWVLRGPPVLGDDRQHAGQRAVCWTVS